MKPIWSAALAATILGVMGLVGCGESATQSSNTPPAASAPAPKKEPVLYTGKSCLSQMAGMAARWAPDALPYHLESQFNSESDGKDGKATVWQAMFASPSRRTYRVFTCSGSRLPDSPPLGVTSTPEAVFSPNVAQLMFQSFQLNTDSDAAYAMSQQKGGDKLLEKNPKMPVLYLLDWDTKNKELLWVVVYGDSPAQAKGRGVIDATSGKFLRAG
ncbi:MAG TPA: hypothetical protein VMT67_14550 [Terriglobales bacterium]|nr:hypothetical protein [Terriglobales bacterium]